MVWMLKSMVRLALVTSVQWTPPLLPPVRHWGNRDLTFSRGRTADEPSQVCNTYPDDPGVHCSKHGAPTQDRLADLSHIVQQPAELHRAEVRADGKAGLGLERERCERNTHQKSHCETHIHTAFLLLPDLQVVLVLSWSLVDEALHGGLCAQVQPNYRKIRV